MKILSAAQIRQADQHTIANEPIASIDLMERAAKGLAEIIEGALPTEVEFVIFCGMGNNGGDGLALARLLSEQNFSVQVFIILHTDEGSPDFQTNLQQIQNFTKDVNYISDVADLPDSFSPDNILIDAILGSGLSRPLEGLLREVVIKLNGMKNFKIAIDMPTGLFADSNESNDMEAILRSDLCLTIQAPKLSLLHRDTAPYVGKIEIVDISLDPSFINQAPSPYHYVMPGEVAGIYKPRPQFSYKGTFGHALIMAGKRGSMGAAVLSTSACLRAGAGLVSAHVPSCGINIIQTSAPEAMVTLGEGEDMIIDIPDLQPYNAIAAGPGLGTDAQTAKALEKLLDTYSGALVLDADALNMVSSNRDLLSKIPHGTVLTPHPGEFKRLLNLDELGADYHDKLREFAIDHGVVVVFKDSINCIASPDGELYFMDYGTPALASGGSGDILTGIITALRASGYGSLHAAILGVYLQGTAGELASAQHSDEACLATDVIKHLGTAFRSMIP